VYTAKIYLNAIHLLLDFPIDISEESLPTKQSAFIPSAPIQPASA
jgi:hypothetical protein